jgi:hypothetical protein
VRLITSALAGVLTLELVLAGCGSLGPGAAPDTTTRRAARPVSVSPSASPSVSPSVSVPAAPAASPTAGAFAWHVVRAKKAGLGSSWRPGCPVGTASLRVAKLSYWGFDSRPHTGALVLHRDVVARARTVFALMWERRFPLRSVRPVHEFGSSDDRSMAADNTSAFNCRRAVAAGRPSWSRHAYGRAIDVNPVENPYLFGGRVLPPQGARYRDRSRPVPGMIRRGDPIHTAFRRAGFGWGGDFSHPDYQHVER